MSILPPTRLGIPPSCSSNLSKQGTETNPSLEKREQYQEYSQDTKHRFQASHEEKFARKKSSRALLEMSFKFIVAPTTHYFFSSHRTMPRHRLIRAPAATSRLTVTPGPIQAPDPIFTPGNKDTLIPVLPLSPRIAPSFLRPVCTRLPFTIDTNDASSNLRLAVIVPAPNEHPAPTILSPTYDK